MTNPIQNEYNALPDDVQWAIERADGYMDLKSYARAHEQMKKVPKAFHSALPYQLNVLRLAMAEEQWITARDYASALRRALPDQVGFWIQHAFATRRAETLDAARAILAEAMKKFPDEALIPYNLGCYACVAQETDAALAYLDQAFALDPHYRVIATRDEDLMPLWPQLEDS